MRRIPAMVLAFLTITAIAGSIMGWTQSGRLTRAKAAELIQTLPNFKEAEFVFLYTGSVGWPISYHRQCCGDRCRLLESLGLITIAPEGDRRTRVSLTDKGKSESKNWQQIPPEKGSTAVEWHIPFAKRQLVEVTGIFEESPSQAQVEYTWKWVRVGSIFQTPDTDVHRDTASVRLYDDGWRAVK